MKSIFKSKTFWVNVAGVALWALHQFAGINIVPTDPVSVVGGLSAGNIALRMVTSQGVSIP